MQIGTLEKEEDCSVSLLSFIRGNKDWSICKDGIIPLIKRADVRKCSFSRVRFEDASIK